LDRPKLFVDYASEDENVAGLISEGLRTGLGIDVFFAPWLLPGEDWVSAIEKALQEAQHVAVFLSKLSVNKEWPTAERNAALNKAIKKKAQLIPVYLGINTDQAPVLLQPFVPVYVNPDASDAVEKAVNEIGAAVYGKSKKPFLGPLPAFVQTPRVVPSGISRTQIDDAVLEILFRKGMGQPRFHVDFDAVEREAREREIPIPALDESMEALKEQGLISFERAIFGGAIHSVRIETHTVEAYSRKAVSDYPARKRRMLSALLGGPDPRTSTSAELIEHTGEEPWLVGHVLRDAERQGYLKLQPVYVGYEFYSVHSISVHLKRLLQDPNSDIYSSEATEEHEEGPTTGESFSLWGQVAMKGSVKFWTTAARRSCPC